MCCQTDVKRRRRHEATPSITWAQSIQPLTSDSARRCQFPIVFVPSSKFYLQVLLIGSNLGFAASNTFLFVFRGCKCLGAIERRTEFSFSTITWSTYWPWMARGDVLAFSKTFLATGARLAVDGTTDVLTSREFFLVLSSTGLAFRRCQLVWINGPLVGVNFVFERKNNKGAFVNNTAMESRN